jgi:hypothetical protein
LILFGFILCERILQQFLIVLEASIRRWRRKGNASGSNSAERKHEMKALLKLTLVALAVVVAARASAAQAVKVGTFDKASIVVAFYGSSLWSAELKAKQEELQHAKQSNDKKRIDALNRWGADSQELAHKQLAGEAPIDNILAMLKPLLPAVAARAHVAAIVPKVEWNGNSVEVVDVTGLLLDQLQATPRTRKIVEDLRKSQKPGASN